MVEVTRRCWRSILAGIVALIVAFLIGTIGLYQFAMLCLAVLLAPAWCRMMSDAVHAMRDHHD